MLVSGNVEENVHPGPGGDEHYHFTVKNILRQISGVTNWKSLGIELNIPPAKLNDIAHDCNNIVDDCRISMVDFWVHSDTTACWNNLADALEHIFQKVKAKEVRELGRKEEGGNTPSDQGGTTWQHTSGTEDVVASDGESDYPDDLSAVQVSSSPSMTPPTAGKSSSLAPSTLLIDLSSWQKMTKTIIFIMAVAAVITSEIYFTPTTSKPSTASTAMTLAEAESQERSSDGDYEEVTGFKICFREVEGSSQCQLNRDSCSSTSSHPNPVWTSPFRDDTDYRSGGCLYQWSLVGTPQPGMVYRICFKETEGSSQCQLNRNSCSGWSNSPSWSPPFRDDTDGRSGGCTYQWRIEEQIISPSSNISACRVCFQETEGSSQCQEIRGPTCSGWSTSPSPTDLFRDDTDGRPGGCTYQWYFECR